MDIAVEITVTPWPRYPEDGGPPTWEVQVAEPKRTHRGLIWAPQLDRFWKSWEAMHLRRSAPAAHREAVRFMREFCSKNKQIDEQVA